MSGHKLTKLLLAGGIGLLIVGGFIIWGRIAVPEPAPQQQADTVSGGDNRATRGPIPYDAAVPEKNSVGVAPGVAVPGVVAPAGPATSALFRAFHITAVRDAFTPSTIIVYRKDTVSITLTAEDHDYNFVQPDYGFNVMVKKGESKKIEFGATAGGTFTYYCSMCENKKVEGTLLITEHE